MSHLFWPGSGLQVGQVLRASSGLLGSAKAEGRRARRKMDVNMDFMVGDCLDTSLMVVVVRWFDLDRFLVGKVVKWDFVLESEVED